MEPPISMNLNEVTHHPLAWLAEHGPGFCLNGDDIKVLHNPNAFYNMLVKMTSEAKKRITIASLYIGTGDLEQKLVDTISHSMASDNNLRLKILLDFTRGSRGTPNSRTILIPVLKKYPSRCLMSLYHTPFLRGWFKQYAPQRWNEIIGLQHMKVYICDNTILISGANLSNDYFTNRYDRYLLIHSPPLADFYDDLVSTVSSFSFTLNEHNETNLTPDWSIHPSNGNQEKFVSESRKRIVQLLHFWRSKHRIQTSTVTCTHNNAGDSSNGDTWIFPLIEMGPLNLHGDSIATVKAFSKAKEEDTLHLATGYFNLTDEYQNVILNSSKAKFQILTAHPLANGFYGSRGFSGGVPSAYTLIAKRFYQRILQAKASSRVTLSEFVEPGHTFHAKGLWMTLPGEKYPSATFIGSPNFGLRSVLRDLETQIAVITTNPTLQSELSNEYQRLYKQSTIVNSNTFECKERRVPLWVKLVVLFFKSFF